MVSFSTCLMTKINSYHLFGFKYRSYLLYGMQYLKVISRCSVKAEKTGTFASS